MLRYAGQALMHEINNDLFNVTFPDSPATKPNNATDGLKMEMYPGACLRIIKPTEKVT